MLLSLHLLPSPSSLCLPLPALQTTGSPPSPPPLPSSRTCWRVGGGRTMDEGREVEKDWRLMKEERRRGSTMIRYRYGAGRCQEREVRVVFGGLSSQHTKVHTEALANRCSCRTALFISVYETQKCTALIHHRRRPLFFASPSSTGSLEAASRSATRSFRSRFRVSLV